MVFLIWLLTAVMVFDCVALIFLVLIQLPKKEAGAGLAFGGSATDALFGAGSGNVLTKITKYAAGIFFILAIILSMMQSYLHRQGSSSFLNRINQAGRGAAAPASSTPAPTAPAVATPGSGTNSQLLTAPIATTNAPRSTTPAEATPPAAPASGTSK
jgi:preprotein translocase subunit SecG